MKTQVSFILILITFCTFLMTGCIDDSPLKVDGKELGTPRIASGPVYGNYYPYAEGIIHAANETMGIFMENIPTDGSLDNAMKLVTTNDYMGGAYMALVQEDIFRYARNKYLAQFQSDPGSAQKGYLKIASQIKVLISLYREELHLLVNEGSGISSITDLAGKKVNIGTKYSGTYITATTILDAHNISYTAVMDDPQTGVNKVISGECDAAFFVTAAPSSVFSAIPAGTAVELIAVQMPSSSKYYAEKGTIKSSLYPFQDKDIDNNIQVETLLAVGPNFEDRNLKIFLDYLYAHSDEYTAFNQKWGDLSLGSSSNYMISNADKCNYRALSYVSGFRELDPASIDPYFYSAEGHSSYHDLAVELIWLLSHNLDIDLRESYSTGAWENSYRIFTGSGSMGIIQDDLYSYLGDNEDMYSTIQGASMRKVAPLQYEYLHAVVKRDAVDDTDSGNSDPLWQQWYFSTDAVPVAGQGVFKDNPALQQKYPISLKQVFTDNASDNPNEPKLYINVGPKTSGSFMTAMKVIDSYRECDFNGNGTPDMEEMEIHFNFDAPEDGVDKVRGDTGYPGGSYSNGGYHIAFVMSGVPYHRFYSHDTYTLSSDLAFIPSQFYDADNDGDHSDDTPYPYSEGKLVGHGEAVYENYPYPERILDGDEWGLVDTRWDDDWDASLQRDRTFIKTVRTRALLVASPAFKMTDTATFLKSIFRKAEYIIYGPDSSDIYYKPNPLWTPIRKESVTSANSKYDTYEEDIIGAKEYFVRNPFGWTKEAVKYYLSLFPGN